VTSFEAKINKEFEAKAKGIHFEDPLHALEPPSFHRALLHRWKSFQASPMFILDEHIFYEIQRA